MRDLLLHNFWLKAVALTLAVVVWFAIKFDPNVGHLRVEDFALPIQVLSAPDDSSLFELKPPEVHLRIRATSTVLDRLGPEDLLAFVRVAFNSAGSIQSKDIKIYAPPSVEILKIEPASVVVEISPLTSGGAAHHAVTP